MSEKLIEIARYIAENCDQKLALSFLARRAFLSPTHFQKKFKNYFGVSPKEFQTFCRKKQFRNELKNSNNILEAIYSAGFGSVSRVYGINDKLGMEPKKYKSGGINEVIFYAIAEAKDFSILMAASAKGVCAVEIGGDENTLLNSIKNEFPKALFEKAKNTDQLLLWVELLKNYIDKIGPRPEIPLDIRGTLFEQKVWNFLLSHDKNNTTYSKIAAQLNLPNSARAVANAVAKNKIAILIPCHKVLRADGGLGGYKWGTELKETLLAAGL